MKYIKIVILFVVLSVVNSSFILSEKVHAIENESVINDVETKMKTNTFSNNTITKEVWDDLISLSGYLSLQKYNLREIGYLESVLLMGNNNPWNVSEEGRVGINSDMRLIEGETLAAHNADLNNSTGTDQTMTTAAFEYEQENSVVTRNSHTTGSELTTSAEMKFPIASGSMSMKVKYEFNHTREVKTTEKTKWSIPAQQVKVPAGHNYKVYWLLNTGVATGTVNLQSHVEAVVPFKVDPDTMVRYGYNMGNALSEQQRIQNLLEPVGLGVWGPNDKWERDGQRGIRTLGTSTYTARYGTELVMKIMDVSNSRTPIEVATIPMDVTPTIVE